MNPPMKIGSIPQRFRADYTRSGGYERSALILGQRPTSPKGAQCYVGPLVHCGSHCCANYITTGSGRDLPSVARNSVSRGLTPGGCTIQQRATPATPTSDVVRHDASDAGTPLTFVALRDVTRRINAEVPYVHTPAGYVLPVETCLSARVGGRELITRSRQRLRSENASENSAPRRAVPMTSTGNNLRIIRNIVTIIRNIVTECDLTNPAVS